MSHVIALFSIPPGKAFLDECGFPFYYPQNWVSWICPNNWRDTLSKWTQWLLKEAGNLIDWCCFYYFVRNSLVALLEALCARIFSFRFVNIGFCFWKKIYIYKYICIYKYILCVCVRSLTNSSFRLSQPGSCAWLSPFLLCADCTCVLVCVCLCMCMWKCVGKVTKIWQI